MEADIMIRSPSKNSRGNESLDIKNEIVGTDFVDHYHRDHNFGRDRDSNARWEKEAEEKEGETLPESAWELQQMQETTRRV